MGDLSLHFSKSEFACHCGCGFGLKDGDISPKLIEKLEPVREMYGEPLIINSGCRCYEQNRKEGGMPDSSHIRGLAADIKITNSSQRYQLLILLFNRFYRVGIAKGFIHVDVDTLKPQDVCWMY